MARRPLSALLLGIASLWALASASMAKDYVDLPGRVTDESFHAAVSCGASLGGSCQRAPVYWPAQTRRDLTVSVQGRDPGFSATKARQVVRALNSAVAQINGAGADLRLRMVTPGTPAKIQVFLRDIAPGERITGTGVAGLDGVRIQIGRFHLRWTSARHITEGTIVLSSAIAPRDIPSVVLEELIQSMGLMWDIRSAGYRNASIFDEDSNSVTRLTTQDRSALRLHYPADR